MLWLAPQRLKAIPLSEGCGIAEAML